MPAPSTFRPLDIPNVDTLTLLFDRARSVHGFPADTVILRDYADSNRFYTHEKLRLAVEDFGGGLRATYRIRRGDVVSLFALNDIDTGPVLWGAHYAGAVVAPATPTLPAPDLAHQMRAASTKVLVTSLDLLPVAIDAAKQANLPLDRVLLLGAKHHPTGAHKHFTSLHNQPGTQRFRKLRIKPETDLAYIVFSSGTTGLPKGVMLSHRNIVSNILQMASSEGGMLSWRPNNADRLLAFLPFSHIYGLLCLHTSIYRGLEMVVMARFDLQRWCEIVQQHRITFSYVVPPVVLALSKNPIVSNYDLRSLRMLNSGAAPLSRELAETLYARLGVGVTQGYGLSETSPLLHVVPWDRWLSHLGSAGILVPNLEIKFLSIPDDGNDKAERHELPIPGTPDTAGEICVRGPNVFVGYLNNPEATAACLTPDGWFHTGDVGYQDADGHLYITDRAKELIKYKGFQVPPAELEGFLASNPDIADAAVVGKYDDDSHSEVPVAYIVPASPGAASPEFATEIINWLNARVAPYKRLRGGVRFIDAIPKSVSGKILRRELKELVKKEGSGEKAKL